MRLYTRAGATTIDDPEWGHFDADEDGAFDLPEEFAEQLRGFHIAKKPQWETDVERQQRLFGEEMERRKDPSTLLSAVEQLVKAASRVGDAPAPPSNAEAKPRARKPSGPNA